MRASLNIASVLMGYAAAILALFTPLPASAAQKVGVAAAVNQNALAGGQVVNIGKSVFYNQRVTTNAVGLVQVLLVDGSTFTVGPNSNLVIDKFVYDPARGKGEMTATVSKGVLRYVGGKLSKNEGAVQVRTPHGQLGIRGGITQIEVNAAGGRFLFDFGELMQLFQRSGYTLSVYQPGNLIDLNQGPAFIRPATPEDIAFFLSNLTSKPGQDGGSGGGPTEGEVITGLGNQGAEFRPNLLVKLLLEETEFFQFRIEDATTDRILQLIASRPEPVDPVDSVESPIEPHELLPVFTGFAAGLYYRFEDSGDGFNETPEIIELVTSEDSNGVQFTFAPNGVISGPLSVNGPEGGAVLRFGDDPNPSVITVPQQMVRNLSLTTSINERQTGFCENCDFIRWGNWTGTANFDLASQPNVRQRVVVDRGFWVAGQVTPAGDLPTSGEAVFAGDVIGTVVQNGVTRDPTGGTFQFDWNFGTRLGDIDINFDNGGIVSIENGISQPLGVNLFAGQINGNIPGSGVTGIARGSFANAGGSPAGGVIGNFELRDTGGQPYRATGIFAGPRVPSD